MVIIYLDVNEKDRTWFQLNGTDYGTGYEFENDIFAVTDTDQILDCDGCPLTEGNYITIAVRNSVKV